MGSGKDDALKGIYNPLTYLIGIDINNSLFPSLVVMKQLPINPTLDRILKAIIMNH